MSYEGQKLVLCLLQRNFALLHRLSKARLQKRAVRHKSETRCHKRRFQKRPTAKGQPCKYGLSPQRAQQHPPNSAFPYSGTCPPPLFPPVPPEAGPTDVRGAAREATTDARKGDGSAVLRYDGAFSLSPVAVLSRGRSRSPRRYASLVRTRTRPRRVSHFPLFKERHLPPQRSAVGINKQK